MDEQGWVEEVGMAVTVTDVEGRIIAMNRRSVDTFAADGGAALLGSDVFACHPEPSRSQLREMFAAESAHHYTITKGGRRKMIHQLPWYRDGVFAGFVELAVPIGDDLHHFDRG